MTESGKPLAFDDVASLVDIPEDGTLSKVIHRGDGIGLVLFAFDRGQELTEHTAAVPAALQVVTGRLAVRAGDLHHELVPGGFVHLPAHASHSVEALEPTVLLITMVRAEGS